jgi:IS5 family transposase
MIGTTTRQSNLFFLPLSQQLHLCKDDLLEPVDALLDDAELVDLVRQRLAQRRPLSQRTGRYGMAPDRLLRCCVLKHLKGWSLRELERELRGSLVYRRFTRYDADVTPDFCTFSRTFGQLGVEATEKIHDRVVRLAQQKGVAVGRKLRTDTTVVETNVHYPTDSTLLGDGVRVLTRALKRVGEECAAGAVHVVDHARAVKHRLLEISRAAKCLNETGQQRLRAGYEKLLALAGRVVRQAGQVLTYLQEGRLPIVGSFIRVLRQEGQLKHFLPLVEQVVEQTKQRIWEGNRHVAGKVLSLFEAHTQAIRKGKAHKPTEFGRLVRIDEVENGIVSHYEVLAGNRADTQSWVPALEEHDRKFGRAPDMATADRGFYSAQNEREARARGVKRVVLPARGRLSGRRARWQKQRWFQRGLRWRAGIEATISTLKHPFSMARAGYQGEEGFERYVGWCVITKNLVAMARTLNKRGKTHVQRAA